MVYDKAKEIRKLGAKEAAEICKRESQLVLSYKKDGYVYTDLLGHQAFGGVYAYGGGFQDGQALVSSTDWGEWDRCIDTEGRVLYSVKDMMQERGYRFVDEEWDEGLRKVSMYPEMMVSTWTSEGWEQNGGLFGYIDENGKEIISPVFTEVWNFSGGRLIAAKGKLICDERQNMPENYESYHVEDQKWGVVDKTGKEIIPFVYDQVIPIFQDDGGFAACIGTEDEGEWFIFDRDGRKLTDRTFPFIWGDENTQAPEWLLFRTETWFNATSLVGLFDLVKQQTLIEPNYNELNWIGHGYLLGKFPDEDPENRDARRCILFSPDLKPLFRTEADWIYCVADDVFLVVDFPETGRFVDREGKEISVSFSYDGLKVDDRSQTDSGILYDKPALLIRQGENWGLVSPPFHVTVPAKCEDIKLLTHGFLMAKNQGKWGVIDRENHLVIPFQYDKIQVRTENLWIAEDGERRELYEVR